MTSPRYDGLPEDLRPEMPVRDHPTAELMNMVIHAVIRQTILTGQFRHDEARRVAEYVHELTQEVLARSEPVRPGDVLSGDQEPNEEQP